MQAEDRIAAEYPTRVRRICCRRPRSRGHCSKLGAPGEVVAQEHELREQTTISVLTTAPVSQRDAVAESNHRIANNLSLLAGMVITR